MTPGTSDHSTNDRCAKTGAAESNGKVTADPNGSASGTLAAELDRSVIIGERAQCPARAPVAGGSRCARYAGHVGDHVTGRLTWPALRVCEVCKESDCPYPPEGQERAKAAQFAAATSCGCGGAAAARFRQYGPAKRAVRAQDLMVARGAWSEQRAARVLGILAMVQALASDRDLWGFARYFVQTFGRLLPRMVEFPEMLRAVWESKVFTGTEELERGEVGEGAGSGAVALVRRAAWALCLAQSGELYESSEVFPLPGDCTFNTSAGGSRWRDLDSLDLWSDVGLSARQWAGWKLASLATNARDRGLQLGNILDADEGAAWWRAARLVTLAADAKLTPEEFAAQLGGAL